LIREKVPAKKIIFFGNSIADSKFRHGAGKRKAAPKAKLTAPKIFEGVVYSLKNLGW
jgi:hypothetical protein